MKIEFTISSYSSVTHFLSEFFNIISAMSKSNPSPQTQSVVKKEERMENLCTNNLHPLSQMVNRAIKVVKERRGSYFEAIKKFIAVNYKFD